MCSHKSESYLANRREKKHREKENSKKLQVTCRGSNYLLRRERMAAWHGGAPSSDCGCGGGSQRGSKIRWHVAHDRPPGHARRSSPATATATSRAAPSTELISVAAVGGAGRSGRESAVWDSPRRRPAGGGGNQISGESAGGTRLGEREREEEGTDNLG
jgi:hypothetical protein